MFKVGDSVELTIDDVAFGGDGVGRVEDCVVFVPFTIRGERVRAQITAVKKQFATAALQEILIASLHRSTPTCHYFGTSAKPLPCGGCQYQHMDYAHQLELKTAQVREALRRIGGIEDPPLERIIASPRPYGYRNHITMRRRGRILGYLASDNRTLLNVNQCPLADESLNTALTELRLRLNRETILSGKVSETDISLRHTSTEQVSWFVEPTPANKAPVPMWVDELVLGKKIKLPPASFFQVNPGVMPALLRLVQESFTRGGCDTVVDAYCGVGLFALFLAEQAKRCIGIEFDTVAINAARYNAEQLGAKHCEFHEGKVERLLTLTLQKVNPATSCVILDPPRAGCEPSVVEIVRNAAPAQIIYISCNPPALARDLKQLLDAKTASETYRLERIVPLDMFPQTAHCEVFAELRRLP